MTNLTPTDDVPEFTPEETDTLTFTLMKDALGVFDEKWEVEQVYVWSTECWSCHASQTVWLQPFLFGSALVVPEDRDEEIRHTLHTRHEDLFAAAADSKMVTTKRGGTYFGFTCTGCGSVLGRHFLKVQALRMLLDGGITKMELVTRVG